MEYRLILAGFLSLIFISAFDTNAQNYYPYVVYLQNDSIPSSNDLPIGGTGFIALHKSKYYVITASHVAKDMDKRSYIKVNKGNCNFGKINIINLVKNNCVHWQYHAIADMAILELDSNINEIAKIAVKSNHFIKNNQIIVPKIKLDVIGFPLSWGSYDSVFSPFVWESYTVNKIFKAPTLNDNKLCDFIFISPCVQRGNSGGPVIKDKSNYISRYKIIGIVHGCRWDNQVQGRPILDMITPMYYFYDMIKD
jgi:hypothetical protein